MHRSRAVFLVTSGCLCYNCVCLLAGSGDWGPEALGRFQHKAESGIKTVFNFLLFTNAASDIILMCSLYFKEYRNSDPEGRNIIGILKMFIAWNAVTISLSWITSCIQVFQRYAEVRGNSENPSNSTDTTTSTTAFPTSYYERQHPQARYFWTALLVATVAAGVRVFVLVWFFMGYLCVLEAEAQASLPLSPEVSTGSVVDPRNPWRWFIFKKHAASASRPRSAHEGCHSRRGGADTRSLASTCVGWLTPVSRRSAATPLESGTIPRRHRDACSRSRSRAGRRLSVSNVDVMGSPSTLHDPAELGGADATKHMDAHTQTGAALRVVPNRERVSYIWSQTSDSRCSDAGGLCQRPPSVSSFEAMQAALLAGRAPRHDLRHFADATLYDVDAVASFDMLILPPTPRDDSGHREASVTRSGLASLEDSKGADGVALSRTVVPSDGFDETYAADDSSERVVSKRSCCKRRSSLFKEELDGSPRRTGSPKSRAYGKRAPTRRLFFAQEPGLVAESDRDILECKTEQAATPLCAQRHTDAAGATPKSVANHSVQEVPAQRQHSPYDREQEGAREAGLSDNSEVVGGPVAFGSGGGGASSPTHLISSSQQTPPDSSRVASCAFRAWPSGAFTIISPKAKDTEQHTDYP